MTRIMMKPLVLLKAPARIEWKRKEREEVVFTLDFLVEDMSLIYAVFIHKFFPS